MLTLRRWPGSLGKHNVLAIMILSGRISSLHVQEFLAVVPPLAFLSENIATLTSNAELAEQNVKLQADYAEIQAESAKLRAQVNELTK